MVSINIVGSENQKVGFETEVKQFVDFLMTHFSGVSPFSITIRLHDSREGFDAQLGKKTQKWEVGNSNQNNEIDILSFDVFEKISSHPQKDFLPILKHEISHIFIKEYTKGKAIPLWLNEGLSMCLAGQIEQYSSRGLFVENDFLQKISTQYGWDLYSNYDAYRFSCLLIGYLIKNFSLTKILLLLNNLDNNYYFVCFEKKFKKIFKTSLHKIERNFVQSLK